MSEQSRTEHALNGQTRIAYEKHLKSEGVPYKQHSYYVVRANQFIRAGNGRDPGSLQADEIGSILEDLGRDDRLADWQFAQLVEAVRILLSMHLVSTASGNVDWSYWNSSAHSVSGDHSTTAREHSPDELTYLKISTGTGMRVMEALTLRLKDVDFEYDRIHVCQAKGKKDRFVPLPKSLVPVLRSA